MAIIAILHTEGSGIKPGTVHCGDPHLHTHVIVPNRQARADGVLVSLDSKSLYHEAKAAGMIYQATLRHLLHSERGFEWQVVDPRSGMAEIAGVTKEDVTAWSRRSTRLREWAAQNLVVVDGEPTAAQLAAAQKATRPTKPESLGWEELKAAWRADARGLHLDRDAHSAARTQRTHETRTRTRTAPDDTRDRVPGARERASGALDRASLARITAVVDKAAFTRADLVELLGAHLPVDVVGAPRELIEQSVDAVAIPITPTPQAHHREGHQQFTVAAVIAEEAAILDMVDSTDNRSRLDLRPDDLETLSADQAGAVANIAISPWLVQPLQAPAGAGKTHSLKALRAAAHRATKRVLVCAPTGKAVDEALAGGAGDQGLTVAKALYLFEQRQLEVDRRTLIVVDEASMVATADLHELLSAAIGGHAKIVLVGDPYQLSPVLARGGMFEHLCAELPWTQRLSAVWRMHDPDERIASLALRDGRGNRLRHAVGWYRTQGRLHCGDPVAMATDALHAYQEARAQGRNALLVCDTWEMADALNRRLHDSHTTPTTTAVSAANGQRVSVGDLIMSRRNDPTITVGSNSDRGAEDGPDQVRNGNRWHVVAVDPDRNRLAAQRLGDGARVVFDGDYLTEHVSLGYAATVHAAQGVTTDTALAVIGDNASRAMAYVALTRGRNSNYAFIYQRNSDEGDHQHGTPVVDPDIHTLRRGNSYSAAHLLRSILANDDRPATMHTTAERTGRQYLSAEISDLLDQNQQRRATRAAAWKQHAEANTRFREGVRRTQQAAHTNLVIDTSGLEF